MPSTNENKLSNSGRILVVEDEEVIRELLSDFLSDQGFEVVIAENGDAGLSAFAPGRFRAVLVDYGLPGMHGIEVCRKIAASDLEVRLLLMTGMGTLSVAEQEPCISRVIPKPFDLFVVLEELQSLLSPGVS